MKLLFDLFPVILFFVTYKLVSHGDGGNACLADQIANLPWTQEPILLATAVAIVATFVQVAWVKYRHGKVDTMLWVSLWHHHRVRWRHTLFRTIPLFIKWKPTVLYWSFPPRCLLAPVLVSRSQPDARTMLEAKMELARSYLAKPQLAVGAVLLPAGLRQYRRDTFSCPADNWVNFKLFGVTSLMFVFILIQASLLSKYVKENNKEDQ